MNDGNKGGTLPSYPLDDGAFLACVQGLANVQVQDWGQSTKTLAGFSFHVPVRQKKSCVCSFLFLSMMPTKGYGVIAGREGAAPFNLYVFTHFHIG